MNCEMCGADAELFRASVEGVELNICAGCGRFGKVIGRLKAAEKPREEKRSPRKEKAFAIVPDYGRLVKDKREQLSMSQKDFAKMLSERESIIHRIEIRAIEPSVELAQKLEKVLGIRLVEEVEEGAADLPKPKREELTLGDFVKVRKR